MLESIGGDSCYAKMRAADGRGPLFWSHEFYNQEIIDALVSAGADIKARNHLTSRGERHAYGGFTTRAPPSLLISPFTSSTCSRLPQNSCSRLSQNSVGPARRPQDEDRVVAEVS